MCEILQMEVVETTPKVINHRINIDPLQRSPFQFAYYPQCQTTYELSPGATWITVNELTGEIEIDPTSLSEKGTYDFTLTKKPVAPNIGVSSSFDFSVNLINECEEATFLN